MTIVMMMLASSALANDQNEINHLLDYVKNTTCQYERNGKMHSGKEALKHINKKYEYFADDIKTTEDFIKYSATKSKMSGKYYKIHCPEQAAVKSQTWLLAELKRYRTAKN
jgi:hypothetical protein